MHTLTFSWRNENCEQRIEQSQRQLFTSCLLCNIKPILHVNNNETPKFGNILKDARKFATNGWMAYINSDCILTSNPFNVLQIKKVHGFHRTEIPSQTICAGVDMYIIPTDFWDEVISKDIPDMYVGTTHIDWWLTRVSQKYNFYVSYKGLIIHESHSSKYTESDEKYKHNIKSFNEWADRNNISKI